MLNMDVSSKFAFSFDHQQDLLLIISKRKRLSILYNQKVITPGHLNCQVLLLELKSCKCMMVEMFIYLGILIS